ncbi:MAG: pseudouridine synthase [Planctomycetota bacterium]
MPPDPKRRSLDRHLSRCGVASRKEAATLVEQGRIEVNGRPPASVDVWIDPRHDQVTLDGQPVTTARATRLILFNKPRGVVVTERDEKGRETVRDRLPPALAADRSLRAVGRLDRASGGLLLLTNDNLLADRILGKGSGVRKLYRVKVAPPPGSEALQQLRDGIVIGPRETTAPAEIVVERTSAKSAVLRIAIEEGRNRQIRRMASAVGCEVEWLVRIAIGPLELGDLRVGEAREASHEELEMLSSIVSGH